MGKKIVPVSVLIPTMNRPHALNRTLDCYCSAQYIPSQIVVIDQSESEVNLGLNRKILARFTDIKIVYYYQEKPSLTIARNKALSFAENDIIICSDDDVDVYEDTVKKVYDIMQNSNIAMIAGIDENMPSATGKIGYLLGTKSFKYRHIGHITCSMLGRFPDKIDTQIETMWAMGFFFVIRKSLMQKWKVHWDERLTGYAYAEDLDFSYSYYKKAHLEGLKCILSDNVRVKHMVSKEYRTPSRKSTFMYILNRVYLSYKHNMGYKSLLAMEWCNFWILLQKKMKSEKPEDMKDAIVYCRKNRGNIRNGIFPY